MRDLTTGNTYKKFFMFAIPLILSGLLSDSFNIVNQILSGRYLGEYGLAVSGSISGFITFYSCTLSGFATGFTVLITQLYGEKNYKDIKNLIYTNSTILLLVTSTIGITLFIFRDFVMDFLKVDSEIRETTKLYFSIMIVPYFLTSFRLWGNHIIIALGHTGFSFKSSLLASVLGIVLKVIALSVLKLGIISIAIITQIVSIIMFIVYTTKLNKCFKEMGVLKEKVKFNKKLFKDSFSLGVPSSFQQMIMYVVSFLISPVINGIGTSATASYSVILNIQHLSNTVYQNTSKALTNYCAQCIGKRKFDKIKNGVKVSFVQSTVLVIPIIILCAVFALPLCKMYFPNGFEGESLNYCVLFIRFYQPFVIFNLINNMFHSFYRGVRAMKLLVVSTLVNSVARLVITLMIVSSYGMNGIFIGWVMSWIIEAIFNVIIFYTGVWKKEKINKIIEEEGLTV